MPHLTSLYHFHRAGEYGDRKLSRQLRRQPHQGLAALFQADGLVCDPMSRQRHLPRRVQGTRHPLHVVGHPPGLRRLRPARISRQRRRSISSGLTRPTGGRSSTPTIPATCRDHRRSSISCGATASSSATVPVPSNPAASWPSSWAITTTARPDSCRSPTTPSGSPSPPGLRQHCTDIIRFSHGASSSKKVYRSSFIPGLHDVCMIFEKAN